ncbi:hypothetical protein ACHAXT_004406 [Thalassiosira profunda]
MKSRSRLTRSLIFVSLLCFGSGQAQQAGFSGQRELTLECPADDFNEETEIERYEGRYDRYSKGDFVSGLVRKMRTKPEAYYQDIVDSVIMLLCDVDVASERCVEKDSPLAAKDWTGENCITATDNTCPAGTCERTSNCYWASVVEGQNRTTRFEPERYARAATALYGTDDSYAREVLQFGAIGCIVAIVLLLLWVLFFIGRYFCCCLWVPFSGACFLCSPIPKKEGYNVFVSIIVPVFLYLGAVVAIVVAGSSAFVGNEDVSVALSNTFLQADGLVEDLGLFLGRSRTPIVNLEGIVNDAALDAQSIFNGTEFVKADALQIVDSFLGYFSLHSQGLNASGAIQAFDSASSGFDEKVTPITDSVQDMLDTLEGDLYANADTIKGGLGSALSQLDSFSDQTAEYQTAIYEYEGQELGTRDVRRAGVMAIFLISFFFAFLGLLGILVSKKRSRICHVFFHCIKITGFFSVLLGSLSLVLASVLLCTSFVLHDACQISDIVTRDFEPFVGDQVSPGANACFNDTNLAVAFNVTEKVDFQQKLDEGLEEIESVNVTEKFTLVLAPLEDIQDLLGSISDTALSALNQATNANQELCPFTDVYKKETVTSPWSLDRGTDSTPYVIRGNQGNTTSFDRIGLESPTEYLDRIYNKAGICSDSSNCCIEYPWPQVTCSSDLYDDCDAGDNCQYPCEPLRAGIIEGYNAYLQLRQKELDMKADLGVVCPADFTGTCPTEAFASQYSNLTLVGMLEDYKDNIVDTKDDLVNLASTSVGEAMVEVQDFLCNMNVSFVERRYDETKDTLCGTLFGGLAQVMWGMWILGISLELIAILAHILTVRLRGQSEKEATWDLLSPDGRRAYLTDNC